MAETCPDSHYFQLLIMKNKQSKICKCRGVAGNKIYIEGANTKKILLLYCVSMVITICSTHSYILWSRYCHLPMQRHCCNKKFWAKVVGNHLLCPPFPIPLICMYTIQKKWCLSGMQVLLEPTSVHQRSWIQGKYS